MSAIRRQDRSIRLHRLVRVAPRHGGRARRGSGSSCPDRCDGGGLSRDVFNDPDRGRARDGWTPLALDLAASADDPPSGAEVSGELSAVGLVPIGTERLRPMRRPAGFTSARWRSAKRRSAPSIPIPRRASTTSHSCFRTRATLRARGLS